MCYCTPEIRTPCCGKIDCVPPTKDDIDSKLANVMRISTTRSQQVLKEKGHDLTFNELLAAVYFQGFKDARTNT